MSGGADDIVLTLTATGQVDSTRRQIRTKTTKTPTADSNTNRSLHSDTDTNDVDAEYWLPDLVPVNHARTHHTKSAHAKNTKSKR